MPLFKGGNACFSTLPVKNIVTAIQKKGTPSSLSNSAVTFVCNHLIYGILHFINTHDEFKGIKAGFIHIPYLPEQVINKPNVPSINFHDISKGLLISCYVSAMMDENNSYILGETG